MKLVLDKKYINAKGSERHIIGEITTFDVDHKLVKAFCDQDQFLYRENGLSLDWEMSDLIKPASEVLDVYIIVNRITQNIMYKKFYYKPKFDEFDGTPQFIKDYITVGQAGWKKVRMYIDYD